jgi:hypothetical protein
MLKTKLELRLGVMTTLVNWWPLNLLLMNMPKKMVEYFLLTWLNDFCLQPSDGKI